MKKGFIALATVLLLILALKLFVFQHKDKCIKSGGVWIENICVNPDTPEEDLKKVGLVIDEKTDKMNINVTYPYKVLEYPKIFKYLENKVDTEKDDNGFNDVDIDLGMSGQPWTLNVDMNNFARGGDLTSILGYVFTFTGGAHPNHSFFSVTFDTESEKILTFNDIFDNEQEALDTISNFAIKDILEQKSERMNEKITEDEWVVEGAGPNLKNYGIFVIVPDSDSRIGGVKFIFPPYKLGAYVEGTYEVVVPSHLIYKYITTKYQDNFIEVE